MDGRRGSGRSRAVVYVLLGIKVANEYERAVVFTLGRYKGLKGPGLYWLAPIFQWQRKVDLRTNTVDVERQETITKDSVTVKVNAVVWYRVSNPKKAVLAVVSYNNATYQVALTSLRNIVGQHVLDEVLKERDKINEALKIDHRHRNGAVGHQGRDGRDEGRRDPAADAARDGAGGAGDAREARAHRQGGGRVRRLARSSPTRRRSSANPMALELRRMQMITEVGAEQNTTTIVMMPSEFISAAEAFAARFACGRAPGPRRNREAVSAHRVRV